MNSIEIINNNKYVVNESCTLIIKNGDVNLEYDLQNGDYNIMIFNDYNGDVVINDIGIIENSKVNINYLELNNSNISQLTNVKVNDNSELIINATYLGVSNKRVVFDLRNTKSDSTVEITNNVVCLDDASFSLECIGTIVKGAKRSKCHQKNHCLTMGNPRLAKVLPVLKIDENDVEASHSLSSGTIDEEVLFYMNSRGLDKKDALGLILRSYLMPNDNYYNGFIDGDYIKNLAESKVNDICSM